MKNAIILHGVNGDSNENWFPWLKNELEQRGFAVWVPDLPETQKPSSKRWVTYILENIPFELGDESYIFGHSAGTVAAMDLLQHLPAGTKVDTCMLVAALKDNLGWENLEELFDDPLDFSKIKSRAKRFIVFQSDDDPYVPIEDGEYIARQLDGEFVPKKNEKHFSVSTADDRYVKLPFLLDYIK